MGTILSDVKETVGVDPNNLGFDTELLLYINAVAVSAYHNGVVEFEDLIIDEETVWPEFSPALGRLIKPFLAMKVRSLFDPIPSETIAKVLGAASDQLEGRIAHEIDEGNDV